MSKQVVGQHFYRYLAVASLLIAVLALGISVWVLSSARQPASAATPASVQSDEAKLRICEAFNLVRSAVTLQTNVNLGNDPVAAQAVAANARLAALGGGQFLMSRVDGGLPTELADAVRTFAEDLEYIGVSQLAGERVEDPEQVKRMNDAQASAARITELCA